MKPRNAHCVRKLSTSYNKPYLPAQRRTSQDALKATSCCSAICESGRRLAARPSSRADGARQFSTAERTARLEAAACPRCRAVFGRCRPPLSGAGVIACSGRSSPPASGTSAPASAVAKFAFFASREADDRPIELLYSSDLLRIYTIAI